MSSPFKSNRIYAHTFSYYIVVIATFTGELSIIQADNFLPLIYSKGNTEFYKHSKLT